MSTKKELALKLFEKIASEIEHPEIEIDIYFELPEYVEIDGEKFYKKDMDFESLKMCEKTSKIKHVVQCSIICGVGCALITMLAQLICLNVYVKYLSCLCYIVGVVSYKHNIYYQT